MVLLANSEKDFVFTNSDNQNIEDVIKYPPEDPDLTVNGETSQFPLHLRKKDQFFKSWLRKLTLSSDQTMKIIYNELAKRSEMGT